MRIGILTFHRAHNYGAVLQCYALQEVLKSLGHDVEVIDYRQPAIEERYKVFQLRSFITNFIRIWKFPSYIKNVHIKFKRSRDFRRFTSKYLSVNHRCQSCNQIPQSYDVYVIGSDQVLNPDITHGLDNVFAGYFSVPNHAKKIGYAVSSSPTEIIKFGNKLFEIIQGFDAFSFREKSLCDIANKQFDLSVFQSVDPTLLTNSNTWDKITIKETVSKPYIVLYQVRYPLNNHGIVSESAYHLANKYSYDVVDISEGVSVEKWISTIKYAQCVVTSSFHATVFALIFNRPLYAYKLNDGSDSRYVDLLNSVGLNENIIDINDIKPDVIKSLNWSYNTQLRIIQEPSLNFLKSSLL